MSERAPNQQIMERETPGLATDVEDNYVLGTVEEDGSIESAEYIPTANITGAATNNRQLQLINKGLDGNGTTVLATLLFDNAINATDYNNIAFTLTATVADRNVVEGDVIVLASTAPGTGLADPGGTVRAVFGRSAAA